MALEGILVNEDEIQEEQIEPTEAPEVSAEPTEVVASESETQARKLGWRPKEEYTGNPNNWVDAEEYVNRGSPQKLREDLDRQKEEFAKFRREQLAVTKTIVEQTKAAEKLAYDQKIAALEARHREGFERGDYETMRAAERARIAEEQKFNQSQLQIPAQNAVSPVFEDFYSRNGSWYGADPALTEDADAYGIGLAERVKARKVSMGLPPALTADEEREIFSKVETRFKPHARAPAPPMVAAARGTPKGKGKSIGDLGADDVAILRYYQKQGLYTGKGEQQFIDDVLAMK